MISRRPRTGAGQLSLAAIVAAAAWTAGVSAAPAPESKPEEVRTVEVSGLVVDPEGQPVAGARVLGVSAEARASRTPRRSMFPSRAKQKTFAVAETTTDDEGRFSLAIEGAAPFLLRADSERLAPAAVLEVSAGDSPTIALTPGHTVTGSVLDQAGGKPVAGIDVELHPRLTEGFGDPEHPERLVRKATTDDRGRFRVDHLEPNFYRVTAVGDGYTRATRAGVEIGLGATPTEPVHLYVEPGVTLRGRVVDPDGSGVEGVEVGVRPERLAMNRIRSWAGTGGLDGKTDAGGEFTIRGVPRAPAYRLEARQDGFAPAWLPGIEVRAGRTSKPLELRLQAGTALTARLMAGDRPFDGKLSAVVAYPGLGRGQLKPYISRDHEQIELEDGTVRLANLVPGDVDLELEVEGYAPIEKKGLRLPEDEPLDLGEIPLQAGVGIRGKVVGADGEPIAGAGVEVTALGPGTFANEWARTEADGAFSVGNLEEGKKYTVSVSARGYGRSSQKEVEPGGEPLTFALEPAGIVRGRVLAGDPPQPVRGFSVTARGKADPGVPPALQAALQAAGRQSFRGETGEFRLTSLTAGTYGLKIEAAGYVTARVPKLVVVTGETTDAGDVILEAGETLHGVVVERGSGRPVGGAAVSLQDAGLTNLRDFMRFDHAARLTTPDGRFTLRGLGGGRHSLRIVHQEFSPGTLEIEIAEGVPPADVTVELGRGGAIEGTYRTRQGEPVDGGMIVAMLGFTPSPETMTSSDENGHFRIDRLTPGTYRVMAMGNPMEAEGNPESLMEQMQMQTAEVVDGKTVIVNIPPQAGGVVVDGVVRKGGRPLEARMFWVRMAAGGSSAEDFAVAASDESGAFQVRVSGPGQYRVAVQPIGEAAGREAAGSNVAVEIPDEVERVTRDVLVPEIVLSGRVLDAESGQPLSAARVTALEHRDDRGPTESIAAASDRTDDQGSYRLQGVAAGEYRIAVAKDGYGAAELGPLEVEDGDYEGLDLALAPASPLRVIAVDERGSPVEGALVIALGSPIRGLFGRNTETDMNGEVTLTGLADGTHDLGVLAAGFSPAVVSGVAVHAEVEQPVVVTLRRGERLALRVLDAGDRPISNAAVRVREVDGVDLTPLLQLSAVLRGRGLLTGPGGTLDLPNLEAGRYEIEVRNQELTTVERVRVRAGHRNEAEIRLR